MAAGRKLVLLGDTKAGKSSIVGRATKEVFDEAFTATIGCEYRTKTVQTETEPAKPDSSLIVLELWDVAGQERFDSMAPMYYRQADIVCFVFDVTDLKSFNKATTHYNNVKNPLPDFRGTSNKPKDNALFFLVGNKIDLREDSNPDHQAIKMMAEEFAVTNNMTYTEVSAKSGKNVNELFSDIAKKSHEQSNPTKKTEAKKEADPEQSLGIGSAIASFCKRHRKALLIGSGVFLALATITLGIVLWPLIVTAAATTLVIALVASALGLAGLGSAALMLVGAFAGRIWGTGNDGAGAYPALNAAKKAVSVVGMSSVDIYQRVGAKPGKTCQTFDEMLAPVIAVSVNEETKQKEQAGIQQTQSSSPRPF